MKRETISLWRSKGCRRILDAAGMESPGLSSAPAVGVYLAEQIAIKANAKKKENFIETRKGIINPQKLSLEEREN